MSFIAKKISTHKLLAAVTVAVLLLTGVASAATVNTPMTENLDANDFNITDINDLDADEVDAGYITNGTNCTYFDVLLGAVLQFGHSCGQGPYPAAADAPDILTVTGMTGNMMLDQYGIAGAGSDITMTCGEGGYAGGTNESGSGGDISLASGSGGSGGSNNSVVCGDGGYVWITSGVGGSCTGSGSYGGDGGDIVLTPGAGGTGTTSSGSYGNVLLAANGGYVGIGTSSPSAELDVAGTVVMDTLVLPVKSTTGDPGSPVEGQIYVNTSDNKIRVYADGAWRDLATW